MQSTYFFVRFQHFLKTLLSTNFYINEIGSSHCIFLFSFFFPQSFMLAIVHWTQFYNFSKCTCKNELNIILKIRKWFQISSLQFMSVEYHCNTVQFSEIIWLRLEKQGRMWNVNVHMLCRMYFVTKHKRQIHLCLKCPQFSLEETNYLVTLYPVVHGYKHYRGACCLHSELKGGAQAWHAHWSCLCIWEQWSSINTYCNLFLHSWCAYALHIQYPHIIIIFTGLDTCVL